MAHHANQEGLEDYISSLGHSGSDEVSDEDNDNAWGELKRLFG